MKSAVLAVTACCIFAATATLAAEPDAVPTAPAVQAPAAVAPLAPAAPAPTDSSVASAPAAAPAATATPAASPIYAPPVALAPPAAATLPASASAGSLLQTILALTFVLALLAALAWAMKRYGPRSSGTNATLRLVSSLNLGGRERILVIEVADQWIVVGAAPGRVNALALMPRQSGADSGSDSGSDSGATLVQGNNFAEWLKQTIDKRHGK
jgi:flagellar protein FliO/FliZ